MAKKITMKEGVSAVILGVSVVILTPMISAALKIPDIFDLKYITIGTAAVAGVVAFVTMLALDKWYK